MPIRTAQYKTFRSIIRVAQYKTTRSPIPAAQYKTTHSPIRVDQYKQPASWSGQTERIPTRLSTSSSYPDTHSAGPNNQNKTVKAVHASQQYKTPQTLCRTIGGFCTRAEQPIAWSSGTDLCASITDVTDFTAPACQHVIARYRTLLH
eukprot:2522144-Rhodomonas_salina.1